MGLVSRLGRKRSSDNSKSDSNGERSRTSGLPLSQSPKDLRNDKYHRSNVFANPQLIGGIRDRFLLIVLGAILCAMMFISFGFPMNSRIYSTLYYNGNSVHLDSMNFKPIAVVSLDNHMHMENDVRTGNFYIEYYNLRNSFEIQLDDEEDDWDPQKEDKKNANCESLGDWQKKHYPTCNSVHEHTLQIRYNNTLEKIGSGGYREVWAVDDGKENTVVLKTLTWDQDYNTYSFNRNLQRHNRDALAMERLHFSPNVVDLYAFCANGGLYEYGHEGSLSTYLRQSNRDSRDDLKYMLQASLGLAAFHSIDDEQKPSIVHNDIKPDQYILIDGVYKLNDFNKAKFLLYDKDTKLACKNKNTVPRDSGIFRSPEEYAQKRLDDKCDIYCFGNSIFMILTGTFPWKEIRNDFEVHKRVLAGDRPMLPHKIIESTDPYIQIMVKVIKMSQQQDPNKRPSAREIANMFQKVLDQYS